MTDPCAQCGCFDTAPRADPTRCRMCHPDGALFAALGRTTPGERDLTRPIDYGRFPGITWGDCRAEVDRELDQRRRTYPDRVASGRMAKADSDYQLAIFAAIGADIDRMAHAGPGIPPAAHRYSWNERRQALGREIETREKYYPEWIAGGRLTQDRADRQLACLRAILWTYDSGFDWRPSNRTLDITAAQVFEGVKRTPEQDETWAEMDAIWRRPDGFFYQRWPDPDTAPAERELAL